MHLDFIAEGETGHLDEFEIWMRTRSFAMDYKDKKGKKKIQPVPGTLRSRRAYSFVFPKEHLDIVLNALNLSDCSVARVDGKGTKILKLPLNVIRKFLRLKRIPKADKSKGMMPMCDFPHLRLIGLGVRDDMEFTNSEGNKQEAL